jgi:hypothetical protein
LLSFLAQLIQNGITVEQLISSGYVVLPIAHKEYGVPNSTQIALRGTSLTPEVQPVHFSAEGKTCQKAALYLYKKIWAEVRWEGEAFVYGDVYKFPPGILSVMYQNKVFDGSGRLARVQNLAYLQKSFTRSDAHDRIEQTTSTLMDIINSPTASEHSLEVSAKLIGMQFQMAGVPKTWPTPPNKIHKIKERIDENGCFESIGNRPLKATLLLGVNGRPAVLEKRVRFVQSFQSKAQQSLAEQIRTFGETSTLTSGEDLLHRARLTLIAAPTDYLRERYQLATQICQNIDRIESSGHNNFQPETPPPSQNEVYRNIAASDYYFQNPCNALRVALLEFGNPIPVPK